MRRFQPYLLYHPVSGVRFWPCPRVPSGALSFPLYSFGSYDEHQRFGIRIVNSLGLSYLLLGVIRAGVFVGDANTQLFAALILYPRPLAFLSGTLP